MKKILTITALTFSAISLWAAKPVSYELKDVDSITQEIQIKENAADSKYKTEKVFFHPMEHFVFDENGNEIFYEDLSSEKGFPEFDTRDGGSIVYIKNDKKHTASYDKNGVQTYESSQKYTDEEIIREWNKNGILIHAKNLPENLKKYIKEIWYDEKGNMSHAIYSWEDEDFYNPREVWYNAAGQILHQISTNGGEIWKAYDKAGRETLYKSRSEPGKPLSESKTKYNKNGDIISQVSKYDGKIWLTIVNKYNKNGKLLSSIEKDSDEYSILEKKCTYDESGKLIHAIEELRYYDDENFKELLPENEVTECFLTYNEEGLLSIVNETYISDETPEDNYESTITYSYTDDKKLLSEKEVNLFPNTPNKKTEYTKNFYYNEDGTWGWTNQKNEVFEFYPSGKKSKETEYGRTYTYDQDGNEISCVRYENGILTGESWTEYDQHKEKCHYKSISYNNDGSLESIWEEITERDTDGNIIFYKLSDTSGKPENNYEYHYEFDSHGNHIRTKGNHPHWLNDLTYIFEYDENDNLIHYKNVYSDYEKWIEYDKDSFPTHLLLRSHTTSMFRASDNLSFYAEVFFVNKCTYHANGKVKDCVRYYYENPYYHQNDDYSYVLKRQKTANEHKANNVE